MTTQVEELLPAPDLFGLGALRPDLGVLAEQWDPTPDPHSGDPVRWINDRLGEEVWSKQQEVADSVVEHRYTAVPSAHDTGKSYIASRIASWWIDSHPLGEAFAVTTAPTWNQVHAILWREMRKAHTKGNLPGRTTLDARWYYGGSRAGDSKEQLVAYGRKPANYDQAAFQGIHAKYVLVIIDEACGVPRLLYDAVDSLATNRHARVLAIGNPDDPSAHFQQICRPGSGWNVIPISAFDTPAFTGEDVDPDLLDLLVSPEWVEERKKRWGEASPTYQSKVLGEFPDVGEDTLIAPKLIREAQERDLSGEALVDHGQYGWDVARYGSDLTVGYRNRGGMIRKEYEGSKLSTMETAGVIHQRVNPHLGGVPAVIDVIGVGAGVVDRLLEQRVKGVHPFNASNSAYEPDRFGNRRAEVFWHFREDMEAGLVDLDPEDIDLAAQLGAIKWKVDSRGRIFIESKDDMKKRGVASPNHADAAIYSHIRGVKRRPASEPHSVRTDNDLTLTGDLLDKVM